MKKASRDKRVAINNIYEKVKKMAANSKQQNTETPEEFNRRVFGDKVEDNKINNQ